MDSLIQPLEPYLLKSWAAPPAGLPILLLLVVLAVCSYVWRSRPSAAGASRSRWARRLAPLAVLLIPAMVTVGVAAMLFPIGWRESVVLRSWAVLPSPRPPKPCFDSAFAELRSPPALPGEAGHDGCKTERFSQTDRIIDAGPLVRAAIDAFEAEAFRPEEVAARSPRALAALRRAVLQALQGDPSRVTEPPKAPDEPPSGVPRWLVQSVEVAVVEGIILERNVHNLLIERHLRAADDEREEHWKRLAKSLERHRDARIPTIRIEDGSIRGSDAHVAVLARPWLQRTADGANLFVLLQQGKSRARGARIRLVRSSHEERANEQVGRATVEASRRRFCSGDQHDGDIQLNCGDTRAEAGAGVALENCVADFTSWLPETSRLATVSIAQQLPVGRFDILVETPGTAPVCTTVRESTEVGPARLWTGDAEVRETLSCLLGEHPAPGLAFFGGVANPPRQRQVAIADSETASEVRIERDRTRNRLWLYPAPMDRSKLEALQKSVRENDSEDFVAPMQPGQLLHGLMLFPSMARADGLPPGLALLNDAPLAPNRAAVVRPGVDPADSLASLPSIWLSRHDAQPVLFAYAKDNFVKFQQRIRFVTPRPIGWRIDTPDGRHGNRPATAWVFALDLARQGLLLENGCRAPRHLPNVASDPPLKDAAVYEPRYEEARFVPFWVSAVGAARISATETEGIVNNEPDAGEVMLLDDETRAAIKMRVARNGMLVALSGMLLHTGLMIWFRYRALRAGR